MAQPAMAATTTYMMRFRNRRADAMERWPPDAIACCFISPCRRIGWRGIGDG